MKKTVLIFILAACQIFAQSKSVYNVMDYGIKNDGTTDAASKINNLIQQISADIQKTNQKSTLYFPAGQYLLNSTLTIPKLLDIEGESNGRAILKVSKRNLPALHITNTTSDQKINFLDYNRIENLTISGPDANTNPFAWKNSDENNSQSVGIKINGLRNRIKNCNINGFLSSGIEINSSYYNYITDSFLNNNRVGIVIQNTSTSSYISNNEFRSNSIAIAILNNSYTSFINNNMIEANIANFLDAENSEDDAEIMRKGKGIVIENSFMNFINNNYFEMQFNNIALKNAWDNEFSDNFFAIGGDQPYKNGVSHSIVKFYGSEKNNRFQKNKVLAPNNSIQKFNIQIIKKDADLSSNILEFEGNADDLNNSLNNKFPKSKFGKMRLPQTSTK